MAVNNKLSIEIWAIDKTKKALKSVNKGFKWLWKTIKNNNKKFLTFRQNFSKGIWNIAKVSAVAFTWIWYSIKKVVDWTSELVEINQKFWVTYSKMSEKANKTAKELANAYWLSWRAARWYLADTGDIVSWLWFTQKASHDFSKQVVSLWVDLASFSNIAWWTDEAVDRLRKWLLWEHENLKALWIIINETMLKKQLLADWTDHLTWLELEQAKVNARMTLAMKQSKNAIWDFARSKWSLANQTRILKAKMQDASDTLWLAFYPVVLKITEALIPLAENMKKWLEQEENMQKLKDWINTTIEVFKNIWTVILNVTKWIYWLWEQIWLLIFNIQEWGKENPKLYEMLKKIWTVIASWLWIAVLLWKIWILRWTLKLLWKSFLLLKTWAIFILKWAFKSLILVVKWLWVALRFLALNPVWLIITAIAGLVYAWYKLYKNWDTVKKKLRIIWVKIRDVAVLMFKSMTFWISNFAKKQWNNIVKTWDNIKNYFFNTWKEIKTKLVWSFEEMYWMSKEQWNKLSNSAKEFFGWLKDKALNWWKNMLWMFVKWLDEKVQAVKNKLVEIAGSIKDYLWFSSPTKEWPNKNSDQRMPNLIKMMANWLASWKDTIKVASEWLASKLNEWLSKVDIQKLVETIWDLKVNTINAFDKISSKLQSHKSDVLWLSDEYKNLKKELKGIEDNIRWTKAEWKEEISKRAVEIQNELKEIEKKKLEYQEKQLELNTKEVEALNTKQQQLTKELEIAKTVVSENEILKAREELEKSQTQRLIDRYNKKLIEFQEERQRIKTLMEDKKLQIIDEYHKHQEMMEKKKELDRVYFDFFWKQIQEKTASVDRLIAKMQRLANLKRSRAKTDWARALWWTVQSWKSYLVWERGPEIFNPSTTWKITSNKDITNSSNISINLWWVVVQKEADENRLVDKIKTELTRTLQLQSFWIS